jgi:DNA-binding transcriptional ArsR family regulator
MKKPAPYDFDPVLTSRVRLAILSALVSLDEAEFTHLKDLLNLTQGNLSVHASKLEEAGYLRIDKKFVDRKPVTTFVLSSKGRDALVAHVRQLKKLLGE